MFRLSIVVPAFNEAKFLGEVLAGLGNLAMNEDYEVIVVDDGSTDATPQILKSVSDPRIRVLTHEQNAGKGQAVRTGIAAATGTHVLVFDADDEYDPADIPSLVRPLVAGRAEVVYGARLRGAGTTHPTFIHAFGNWVMTSAANILYGSAISDLHTCLKLLPLPLVRAMELTEHGFGLDTEITCEMLRRGFRPFELPISYVGRSKDEGKKIKSSDAVRCFLVMFRVRMRGKVRPGQQDRSLAPRVKAA